MTDRGWVLGWNLGRGRMAWDLPVSGFRVLSLLERRPVRVAQQVPGKNPEGSWPCSGFRAEVPWGPAVSLVACGFWSVTRILWLPSCS